MSVRALGLGTFVILAVAISALLDGDSGVAIWLELTEDLAGANVRVEQLILENDSLQAEIELALADPTAVDRAIREELDLALPGEVVIRFLALDEAGAHHRREAPNPGDWPHSGDTSGRRTNRIGSNP